MSLVFIFHIDLLLDEFALFFLQFVNGSVQYCNILVLLVSILLQSEKLLVCCLEFTIFLFSPQLVSQIICLSFKNLILLQMLIALLFVAVNLLFKVSYYVIFPIKVFLDVSTHHLVLFQRSLSLLRTKILLVIYRVLHNDLLHLIERAISSN